MTEKICALNVKYVFLAIVVGFCMPVAVHAQEGDTPPQIEAVTPVEEEQAVDYNTVLSFPITEEKIKAFVIAADKIDQVNRKWDMLISGAETDTMTLEYIDQSGEEMQIVLNGIEGITPSEYDEVFKYTAAHPEFKAIVAAFKEYYVVKPRREKFQASKQGMEVN